MSVTDFTRTPGLANPIPSVIRDPWSTRPPGEVTPPRYPISGGPLYVGPAPTTPTTDDQDARLALRARLAQWGLESLADWAYDQVVVQGKDAEYVLTVLAPEQEAWKVRFAADEERKKRGLPVLGPAGIMGLEAQYRQMFRAAGLPEGFYDQTSDFVNLIGRDVSPSEMASRIEQGYLRVAQAPAEDRAAFAELYGAQGDAAMAAYFLDPDRAAPLLLRQARAAGAAGASQRSGFGGLDRATAERIAGLGLTDAAVAERFGFLVESRPLFTPIDVGEEEISREEQIAGVFGENEIARQAIERRRRRRQAMFEGGGRFATGQEGFAGLGSAAT